MSAEDDLRAAFERLKLGKGNILKPGTPVTQNNVAREAGKEPSAFKKARYPSLIMEIQAYLALRPEQTKKSERQRIVQGRKKSRDLRKQLEDMKKERDLASSLLLGANQLILDLHARIRDLERRIPQGNVVRWPGGNSPD